MYEDEFPYDFEASGNSALRDQKRASEERKKIAGRLGFTAAIPSTEFDRALLRLATHCNLSIVWYQNKLKKEVAARRWYFAISLGLLLLIPLALAFIPAMMRWLGVDNAQPASVTAQLSAALTGLLAFQRGISAWLDRRQVVGAYSKAASDLKTVLYSFEQTWDTLATDPKHRVEFAAAIRAATAKCRDIVSAETDQYYQTLSFPSLDLGSLVKQASSDATSIVATFTPAGAAAADVARARIEQLRHRAEELDAQLARARAANDTSVIAAVTPQRDGVVRELRAAEVNASAVKTQ